MLNEIKQANPVTNFDAGNGLEIVSQLLGGGSGGGVGILAIAIVLAGIGLLVMIVMGGFAMLSNPTNPEAQNKGKAQITYGLVGFLVVFLAYWIMQILEIIFGINVV